MRIHATSAVAFARAMIAAFALAAFLSGCAAKKPRPFGAGASTAPTDTLLGRGETGPGRSGLSKAGPGPSPGPGTADTVRKAEMSGSAKAKSGEGVDAIVTSPAPPRAEPLIMENADRMEGFRSRGEYILSGKVRFSHGGLRLETDRAVWQKDRSIVFCESGMRITHKGSRLTSERGSYDKNLGVATAEGAVRMRDSSGEVEAFGQTVSYNRNNHLATLLGNPELRRYYRKDPDTGAVDTARAGARESQAARGADTLPIRDTLTIRGRILTYNDSARIATAEDSVRITRNEVRITCRKAEYHDLPDSLYLLGQPQVRYDESIIHGLSMRLSMDGEEIKSLLVKGEAHAKSVEPATDTSVARESNVEGDSLFLVFKDKNIDSVQVFRHAKGSYFDVDKPGFVNRMSGEYMVLRFDKKKVRSAGVLGKAKSTYFHLEKRVFKGRNDAEGDTIDFAFKDGKVEEVLVRGAAKGTYFGEAQARKGMKGDTARADSVEAAPKTPPGADRGPSPGTPAPRDRAASTRPAQARAGAPRSNPVAVAPGATQSASPPPGGGTPGNDRPATPDNPWRKP